MLMLKINMNFLFQNIRLRVKCKVTGCYVRIIFNFMFTCLRLTLLINFKFQS
jgi:hypothetical protein